YPWPGNIRELKNVITYACAKAPNYEILLEHLPGELVETCKHPAVLYSRDLRDKLACFEAEVLRQTLRLYPSPGPAAEQVGMELRTMYRRMRKYGLRPAASPAAAVR
ncbi:MAG: hypothetical protein KGJ86_16050, partial [Chloroflexota bacterium]|nr:hypothetical protein [Chloroflexota bacterium]